MPTRSQIIKYCIGGETMHQMCVSHCDRVNPPQLQSLGKLSSQTKDVKLSSCQPLFDNLSSTRKLLFIIDKTLADATTCLQLVNIVVLQQIKSIAFCYSRIQILLVGDSVSQFHDRGVAKCKCQLCQECGIEWMRPRSTTDLKFISQIPNQYVKQYSTAKIVR